MLMTTLRRGFEGSRTKLLLLWGWEGRGPMEVLKALASLWFDHILNLHIGFYLKNIFAANFFFSYPLGEETKVPSWLQQYVFQSHRMCLVFGKVNEIKDKSLQDNCQYCKFDTVFTVKLLVSGRFRGWTQVFQVQGSSQYTTCLFKYFWRSENKYGLFVYGE